MSSHMSVVRCGARVVLGGDGWIHQDDDHARDFVTALVRARLADSYKPLDSDPDGQCASEVVPVRPPTTVYSQPTMKVDHPPFFVSPKLSASSFAMPSRPMKRSRSRSRSRDGQVDRPLVSTLVFDEFEGPFQLDSPCSAETSDPCSCKGRRCLPPETSLSHRSPGH